MDKDKLYTINAVCDYITEPAWTVRMWTQLYNIPIVQKTRKGRKYWRYEHMEQLLQIKKLFRELHVRHEGIKNILNNMKKIEELKQQQGVEYEQNVRESKTVLPGQSTRPGIQRQKNLRTQGITQQTEDGRQNVSEVSETDRNTESTQ